MQASLHGITVPESKDYGASDATPSVRKLTPEQRLAMEAQLKESQERVRKRALQGGR